MMLLLAQESNPGWVAGYTIGIIVVVAVVALVVPILILARSIGNRATEINASLEDSVVNTSALSGLQTTIDSANAITEGLARGRAKLGG
jgi:pilus assembly protein TadC